MGAARIFQSHDVWAGFARNRVLSHIQRLADPAGVVARARAMVLFAGAFSVARIRPHVVDYCRRKPSRTVDLSFVPFAVLALATAVFSRGNHVLRAWNAVIPALERNSEHD